MRRYVVAAILAALVAATAAAQAPLVQVAEPRDGAVVTAPAVTVTGRAEPSAQPTAAFDVVIVIDTSGSTQTPAAFGEHAGPLAVFRVPFGVGGPSILQTEAMAARRFAESADPATTRIGVVTFSEGGGFRADNAWVEQPLSSDYGAVRSALQRVGSRTPSGGTDMVAGIRLAIRELRGLQVAASPPRPEARKVVLLMTDGYPTLPHPSPTLDERNVNATLAAARLAARAEVVIHMFCLGREALSAPVVCREVARATGGTYQPVQRPGDVVDLLP